MSRIGTKSAISGLFLSLLSLLDAFHELTNGKSAVAKKL